MVSGMHAGVVDFWDYWGDLFVSRTAVFYRLRILFIATISIVCAGNCCPLRPG